MNGQNDILQFQDIKSKGYGTITQMITRDKRLKPAAKGVYSYLCSFAGAGNTAFPLRDMMLSELNMGKDSYYNHLNQLKELGYIKVTQERDSSGRFKRNVYTIMQTVPENKPAPCREKQNVKEPDTVKPNNNNNHSNTINRFYNNQVKSVKSIRPDMTDADVDAYIQTIKKNIRYSDFSPLDLPLVDEFVMIMADAILTTDKTIIINGQTKLKIIVESTLMKLTHSHIDYCLNAFKSVTTRITSKRQYILTMLFNSKMEMDAHYTNQVRIEG